MSGFTVAELASLLSAPAEGDLARVIHGANALGDAEESDLSFAVGKQGLSLAPSSRAGCLVVSREFSLQGPWSLIRVAEPRGAFARALQALYPPKHLPSTTHPSALIAESASIAPDVHIGPYVSVGASTVISGGCKIAAGCILGDGVYIGENTCLHPNVTVYDRVRIGARVIIHAGAVLGADGFGFAFVDGSYQKFPQVGSVEIEDDVEIGACCCVDRAALGITRVGRGTKLDNLIHIAHNCTLGQHVVIAAQTGFSGSVTVGDYAVIGGQAGIGEKARIESQAVVGGKAGILTSAIVHAGEPVWGIPARPLRKHLKGLANINKLPELKDEVHQLGQRLKVLENLLKRAGNAEIELEQ